MKYRVVLLAALCVMGCGSDEEPAAPTGGPDASVPTTKIDRSGMTDVGTAPLDYANAALWLCRPGNDPDECKVNLDATEFLKDNTTKVNAHVPAANPAFDCFYVYPTVSLTGVGNVTDFSNIKPMLDPLLAQGARFTRLCTVYAPLYRQVSLSIGGSGDGGGVGRVGDGALAVGDVQAAFKYYMEHLNQGRKFVLIGHSQGTLMLVNLVQTLIDNDPALRAKMISALLIGGSVVVPEGQPVGVTFKNIPACTTVGQTGCVIAYNSFAKEAPPPANTLFGKAPAGNQVLCTEPAALAGNTGRYRGSYEPTHFENAVFKPQGEIPAVSTPFVMSRDIFRGQCVKNGDLSYLEISVDQTPDDMRPVPPYRNPSSESLGFGMHIGDFAIEQDDLLDAVEKQAAAAH